MSKGGFDIPLTMFEDTITRTASALVREIGDLVIRQLAVTAPVDTSRFVSNMNVSFNVPDESHDDNKFLSRAGALAAGLAEMARMPPDVLVSVYFVNTISYGEDLEGGSSPKAPSGTFTPTWAYITDKYSG